MTFRARLIACLIAMDVPLLAFRARLIAVWTPIAKEIAPSGSGVDSSRVVPGLIQFGSKF